MRKRNILLAALVLMAVFTAVTAKEQLNRNVLLLKNGRIIPVDRVWESGADLFYENEKEIHFVGLAEIDSIETLSLSIWLQTAVTHWRKYADQCSRTIHLLLKEGLERTAHPWSPRWLPIALLVAPPALALTLRRIRHRPKKNHAAPLAASRGDASHEIPNRADVVRFFLGLYRHQLGIGPQVPAEFVQMPSAAAGSNQIYELRVKNGGEWVKRRMTLGPLGEDSGSKSKCYYVIFDQHMVVKIPPKPIKDFETYVANIQKERHIVEQLRPKECIVPGISVILGQVHHLSSASSSPPDQVEEKYIAWLRNNPDHQDYLKIKGTFVFFMDLSRYYFLSHIIDSLHHLTDPIRAEIRSTADLIRYPAKFKDRYGGENESIGFEIRDLYHHCEAEVRQVWKNDGKSAIIPYQIQTWFLNFLEKKSIGECDASISAQTAEQVTAVFKRWFEKYQAAVKAYLDTIRIFAARLCLEQNRQMISGILSNLLDLLAWLVEKKVAMRDLKPDNLLVAGDPQNYPAFLRSPAHYSLGFIDVETAVSLDPPDGAKIRQPLLGGTPYYATPSHLFPNTTLEACFADAAWVLRFQDWHAVLVMIFKTVTGEPLFDRTANLFGGIKTRVANAMRRGEPLEDIVPDVSRVFWRSAATEFRAKIKTRETTLKRIEIDLPPSAKALFAQVLRRDIESIQRSVRRQVDTQTYFGSRESRELLQHASYGRVGQVLKTLQAKRRSDSPAPNRFEAAERFLHHLCTLKARLEHNLQLIGTLERMTTPRLSAHEVLLLMFNSVLKSMCHEDWYAFAEDALNHHLPSDDALSLATTL